MCERGNFCQIKHRYPWIFLFTSLLWIADCTAIAQPVGDLPRPAYYVARELHRTGNNQEAATGFESVLSNAVRTSTDGWIDSIPSLVMLGECYYQQGNLTKALEHYNAALTILLKFPAWPDQFELLEAPVAVSNPAAKGINWFRLSQPSQSLVVPDSVQLLLDTSRVIADVDGNAIAPVLMASRLDSSEVLRTVGIALLRRWQILGPLATHSSLTNPLIQYFSQSIQQLQPWAQSSWAALRAFSLLPRDEGLAGQQLRSATLIRNEFDYFLTPLCLFAQGRIAAYKGQYQAAIIHFQDVSILAAQYDQQELLSESMLWLGDCGCANERIDLTDALRLAANWCSKRSPFSLVACLSGLAELSIYAGNQAEAKKNIVRISAALRPRDVMLPRFQARLAYLECQLALRNSQTAMAWNRILAAVSLMQGNAALGAIPERVFQKQLALDLLASGQITRVDADQLLSQLLTEPSPSEWEVQPLETISAQSTSSIAAYLRWLRTGDPQDVPELVARMDRIQQQQVYESLPLAGRKLSWLRAASQPLDQLPPDIRGFVQAQAIAMPALRQIPEQISAVVDQLRNEPAPLDDRQIKPEARQVFSQLLELHQSLENLLLLQTASRRPLRRFAPAQWNQTSTQNRLGPRDLLLGFVVAGDELFAVAQNQQQIETWRVADSQSIQNEVNSIYRQLGLVRTPGTRPVGDIMVPNAQWRQSSRSLHDQILSPQCQTMMQDCDRLIIAPHGFMWSVPFELLLDSSGLPLIASKALTYVPTLGSVHLAYDSRKSSGTSLTVVGSFFSLDKTLNELQAGLVASAGEPSSLINLDQKLTASSSFWLRSHAKEIVILNPLNAAQEGWGMRPIPIDKTPGSSMGDWLDLPQATPAVTLLPALNTSLRTGATPVGNDLYLTACALLYGGSRGLISRWPAGGMSSSAYLQRVRQELKGGNTISGAMRRATLAVWAEQFATSDEPILKPTSSDAPMLTTGEHPLLWAGYMAIGDFLN